MASPRKGADLRATAAADAELDSEASEEAPRRQPRMLVAREEASADLFSRNESAMALKQKPLFERAAGAPTETRTFRGGNRNVTFVPTRRCAPMLWMAMFGVCSGGGSLSDLPSSICSCNEAAVLNQASVWKGCRGPSGNENVYRWQRRLHICSDVQVCASSVSLPCCGE